MQCRGREGSRVCGVAGARGSTGRVLTLPKAATRLIATRNSHALDQMQGRRGSATHGPCPARAWGHAAVILSHAQGVTTSTPDELHGHTSSLPRTSRSARPAMQHALTEMLSPVPHPGSALGGIAQTPSPGAWRWQAQQGVADSLHLLSYSESMRSFKLSCGVGLHTLSLGIEMLTPRATSLSSKCQVEHSRSIHNAHALFPHHPGHPRSVSS